MVNVMNSDAYVHIFVFIMFMKQKPCDSLFWSFLIRV